MIISVSVLIALELAWVSGTIWVIIKSNWEGDMFALETIATFVTPIINDIIILYYYVVI